jgi:hypothetical protein
MDPFGLQDATATFTYNSATGQYSQQDNSSLDLGQWMNDFFNSLAQAIQNNEQNAANNPSGGTAFGPIANANYWRGVGDGILNFIESLPPFAFIKQAQNAGQNFSEAEHEIKFLMVTGTLPPSGSWPSGGQVGYNIGNAISGDNLAYTAGTLTPGLVLGGVVAGLGAAESIAGASSTYIDITTGSSVRNIATNVGPAEFGTNLTKSGFTSQSIGPGTLYTGPEGQQYFVRSFSNSGPPTADYYAPAGVGIAIKIRLGVP